MRILRISLSLLVSGAIAVGCEEGINTPTSPPMDQPTVDQPNLDWSMHDPVELPPRAEMPGLSFSISAYATGSQLAQFVPTGAPWLTGIAPRQFPAISVLKMFVLPTIV